MNQPMQTTPERNYQPKRNSEGRRVARELLADITECQLKHLRRCRGPLDSAHLDGDELNNVRENLRKLCRSHHSLLDKGRITLDTQTMPAFRCRRSGPRKGERRYEATRRGEHARRKLRRQSAFSVQPFTVGQPAGIGATQ